MNPIESIKNLSVFEKFLWAVSVFIVTISFLLLENRDWMTMIASLIGVTALIFVARGTFWARCLRFFLVLSML